MRVTECSERGRVERFAEIGKAQERIGGQDGGDRGGRRNASTTRRQIRVVRMALGTHFLVLSPFSASVLEPNLRTEERRGESESVESTTVE